MFWNLEMLVSANTFLWNQGNQGKPMQQGQTMQTSPSWRRGKSEILNPRIVRPHLIYRFLAKAATVLAPVQLWLFWLHFLACCHAPRCINPLMMDYDFIVHRHVRLAQASISNRSKNLKGTHYTFSYFSSFAAWDSFSFSVLYIFMRMWTVSKVLRPKVHTSETTLLIYFHNTVRSSNSAIHTGCRPARTCLCRTSRPIRHADQPLSSFTYI